MPDGKAKGAAPDSWLYNAYSTYTTFQVVKVKSFTLASVHHGVQVLIVAYIIGFVLIMR
jgi:hypothetical protein